MCNSSKSTIVLSGFTLLIALFCGSLTQAQFSGTYDPSNWSTVQITGANGSVNAVNAPTSIAMTGPDNITSQAYTRYQITVPASGTISFNWSVVHQDPGYDGFGYWYNNTYTELTQITQSGSTTVSVAAGEIFAFYAETFDGCCGTFVSTISNFSGPIQAANDAGIVEILNPNDDFCADSAEVLVHIKNYGVNQISPVTIDWTINGTAQNSVVYSGLLDTAGGSGVDTATVSLGTHYFEDSIQIVAWTTSPNNTNDTVNVNDTQMVDFIAPNPEITLNDQDMCEGEFFILSAEAGFASYIWSNGSTAQQIQITSGGTFSVTVTDETGCQDSATAVVTEYPAPVVDLGGQQEGCDELTLDAGNAGSTFAWNTGDVTQLIEVTSSGFYSVTVENSQGCASDDEVEVTIHDSPTVDLGEDFALCVDLGESAVLAAGTGFTFYSWNTGETTSNIIVGGFGTPTGNEEFNVEVTDENGCTGLDTVKVNFKNCIPAGIAEANGEAVTAFPNPTKGMIQFSIPYEDTWSMSLVDVAGRVLHSYSNQSGSDELTMDISQLESGLYFARFEIADRVLTLPVMRE